ncbi:MAG: tRNA (N6-threonylcarbamoyladenosine(37)-N6)-methyltransferase TrmO [Clostridia bacterium]|nr:tRNA (N6-threonylcarbamoyladenosine(37)-N6)-methyltransferase TrmO [Clostridia bacterium]
MKVIAKIRNGYSEKFGIPRQSGIVEEEISEIVFMPEYRDEAALRGIEGYSHLWLIWEFSEAKRDTWSPTVRPPRLGGNKRMGVFATRSPFRPNPIGLSSVKLVSTVKTRDEGVILRVAGADLLSGTPIYDIKPYLAYTDSHPEAVCGFSDAVRDISLGVEISDELIAKVPEEKRAALLKLLSEDPRPSYIDDPDRIYTFSYSDMEISFKCDGSLVTVTEIEENKK